jgi:uncharacterized protein (DUF2344 family)
VASRLLEKAEYFIKVAPREVADGFDAGLPLWGSWIDKVMDGNSCLWSKRTKSGKVVEVNLRDRLFELELLEPPSSDLLDRFSQSYFYSPNPFLLPNNSSLNLTGNYHCEQKMEGLLRYIGSYCNDGTVLQPKHIVYMLEQVSGVKLELLQVHRSKLIINN